MAIDLLRSRNQSCFWLILDRSLKTLKRQTVGHQNEDRRRQARRMHGSWRTWGAVRRQWRQLIWQQMRTMSKLATYANQVTGQLTGWHGDAKVNKWRCRANCRRAGGKQINELTCKVPGLWTQGSFFFLFLQRQATHWTTAGNFVRSLSDSLMSLNCCQWPPSIMSSQLGKWIWAIAWL